MGINRYDEDIIYDKYDRDIFYAGMVRDDNGQYIAHSDHLQVVKELEEKIESLKCCGNCKHKPYAGGLGELEPRCHLECECIDNRNRQPKEQD